MRRARSEGRPSFCKARAASASALGRRSWSLLTGSEVLILGDGCCRGRRSERRGELAPRCSGQRRSAAWLVWFCHVWYCTVGLVRYGTVRYCYERSARSSCRFPLELRRNSEKSKKKHSDLPLQASECFVPLLYVPAGGRGRSATNFELQTYSLVCSFTPPLVVCRVSNPNSRPLQSPRWIGRCGCRRRGYI